MDDSIDERIRRLVDRSDISDVVVRFATAIDTHDWTLFRTCFADTIEADLTELLDVPVRRMPAEEWVAFVASEQDGFVATQHISTNHVVNIAGDDATCTSYLHAQHCYLNGTGDGTCRVGGRYTYTLVRTPEGWRIRAYKLHVFWSEGNQAVFALARRAAAHTGGFDTNLLPPDQRSRDPSRALGPPARSTSS